MSSQFPYPPRRRRSAPLLAGLVLLAAAAHADATRLEPWPLPIESAAAQPSLAVSPHGTILSWIEPVADGHRLRLARWANGRFGPAVTVAQGRRWFVNAADFPSVQALAGGRLATFFLQRTAEAPYAYSILLSEAADLDDPWSQPRLLHDDGTDTEHGFVAMWAWGEGLGIAWLDGRQTVPAAGHDHHAHGGAMTLRAARLNSDGSRQEWLLDERTCDCCQTDAAMTADGPLVVYRGREAGEVRDIRIARFEDGAWRHHRVHADDWNIAACPVNGPALAVRGSEVFVAWYTEADRRPALKLARSRNGGESFEPPVEIDHGPHLLGRVDLALAFDALWLSWLSEDASAQRLMLARIDPAAPDSVTIIEAAELPRGRGGGFPRMAADAQALYLVWTQAVDGTPRVRGVRVLP